MTPHSPRCKPCRDNDPKCFYLTCAGCQLRRDYINRVPAKPLEHPAISRESFPTSFPPEPK